MRVVRTIAFATLLFIFMLLVSAAPADAAKKKKSGAGNQKGVHIFAVWYQQNRSPLWYTSLSFGTRAEANAYVPTLRKNVPHVTKTKIVEQ
jgi:hypothetical protein